MKNVSNHQPVVDDHDSASDSNSDDDDDYDKMIMSQQYCLGSQ